MSCKYIVLSPVASYGLLLIKFSSIPTSSLEKWRKCSGWRQIETTWRVDWHAWQTAPTCNNAGRLHLEPSTSPSFGKKSVRLTYTFYSGKVRTMCSCCTYEDFLVAARVVRICESVPMLQVDIQVENFGNNTTRSRNLSLVRYIDDKW